MEPNQLSTPTPQPQKPVTKITDDQAQAILAINSLQTKEQAQASKSFLLLVIASIVILVALSLFIGSKNHPKNKSPSYSPAIVNPSNNPFNSNSGNGSVDSEVKYCSNPVNANLTC